MKLSADQQAPLDALTARESELSAPELAELNFLRNIATSEETPSDEPAADDEVTEPIDPASVPDEEAITDAPGTVTITAAKPSIFDRAASVLKGRQNLSAEITELRAHLNAANERNDALVIENADLAKRAAAGEAFAHRVAELESERSTVSQAAARIAASSHVEPADLPETSDDIETLESVRSQMAETSDPKERSRLAKRARVLRDQSASLN